MKHILLLTLLCIAAGSAFSQTYRNQWLVGGKGTFTFQNTTKGINEDYKQHGFTIQPDAGYFIINNLAAGARFSYDYVKGTGISFDSLYNSSKSTALTVAPFVRYYVLPAGNKINILTDASYLWGQSTFDFLGSKNKQKINGYEAAIGPVYFVSSSASLELLADYQHTNANYLNSTFSIYLGFEIHLGKAPKPKKS